MSKQFKNFIGVNRVQLDNGTTSELYDADQVKVQNNYIITQRGAYKYTETEDLGNGSRRYKLDVSNSLFGGNSSIKQFSLGSLNKTDQGILNFLTFKPQYDAQILNLASPKFKARYDIKDIQPNQIKYDLPKDVVKQQYQKTLDQAKYTLRQYRDQDYSLPSSQQLQRYSQKYFKMDNDQIQKYIASIISGGAKYSGSCACGLNQAQPLELEDQMMNVRYNKMNYQGGASGYSNDGIDVLKFIADSLTSNQKYVPSQYMNNFVNAQYDKLSILGGVKQGMFDDAIDLAKNLVNSATPVENNSSVPIAAPRISSVVPASLSPPTSIPASDVTPTKVHSIPSTILKISPSPLNPASEVTPDKGTPIQESSLTAQPSPLNPASEVTPDKGTPIQESSLTVQPSPLKPNDTNIKEDSSDLSSSDSDNEQYVSR